MCTHRTICTSPADAATFNPSMREIDAGGSLGVQGQPGLHSEFQVRNKNIDSSGIQEIPQQLKAHVALAGGLA